MCCETQPPSDNGHQKEEKYHVLCWPRSPNYLSCPVSCSTCYSYPIPTIQLEGTSYPIVKQQTFSSPEDELQVLAIPLF